MKRLEKLYEGKAKKVYKTQNEEFLIVSYKDSATAFNGEKKGEIKNKGAINNQITNHFMRILETKGIKTQFIEQISKTDTIVRNLKIIPLEVIVRNVSAGSFAKRYGVLEGTILKTPTLEFSLKNDKLNDPLINTYHILALEIATKEEIEKITTLSFKINDILKSSFLEFNINLIDFKLEFGTCRLWDKTTNQKLDKDRFRFNLENQEFGYLETFARIFNKK